MRENPRGRKKPTAQAVREKSRPQTRGRHDLEPERATDSIVQSRPLSAGTTSDDGRGYEETTRDEKHDDLLLAEASKKIGSFPGPGFLRQTLEVPEKKARRWPTITAAARTARIRSGESEAGAEGSGGLHATGIEGGNRRENSGFCLGGQGGREFPSEICLDGKAPGPVERSGERKGLL
jgi:hypothetical protein